MPNIKTRNISRLAMMAAVAAIVLIIDQLTKAWVSANIAIHDTRPIIEGFVRLRYTQNSGAAFGLFQGWTGALSVVAVAIIAAIVLSASKMGGNNRASMLAMGLVLGGALGNLADRITLGYVRDFVEVYGPHVDWNSAVYTWPVFNAADSAITIGVLIVMATLIFSKQESVPVSDEPQKTPVSLQEGREASPFLRGSGQTSSED